MRIAQIIAGGSQGGAETYFARLVPALARAGVVQLAVSRPGRAWHEPLRSAGVPMLELPFAGPLDLKTRLRLSRALRAFRPAIVLSWMGRAAAAVPPGPYRHVGRLGGGYPLRRFHSCHHLVVNAPELGDHLAREGWPPERASLIPNFAPAACATARSRADFATPEGVPLLMTAGRLHQDKAVDRLLCALPSLPGAWLWIAGAGPQEASLRRQAETLGIASRVRFLGWREDAPELMALADIVVSTALKEPFGNVIIEAMAAARPVVATATSGARYLLREAETGLMVAQDHPAALAQALQRLIGDPALAQRMGAAGRARWSAQFSEAVVVPRWLELFERLAGLPHNR